MIDIFSKRVDDILKDSHTATYGEADDSQDEVFSYYQWMDILLENNGYLPITTDGEIVYYHSQTNEEDTINVWSLQDKVMTIDKNGNVLSERDDSYEHTKKEKKAKPDSPSVSTVGTPRPELWENVVWHTRFVWPPKDAKQKRKRKWSPKQAKIELIKSQE